MTSWTLIPAASLVAAPWKNGLGTSRDIAHGPGWTISIADLERDAPFSHYPDTERVFMPIAGDPPPLLAFNGGPYEPCPLLVPKRFPGDIPTLSRSPSPGRAFNIFVDPRQLSATVEVRRLLAGDPIELPPAPTILLHCLSGAVAIAHAVSGQGDSLLGANPDQPGIARQDTVLLVATIRPQ